MAHITQDSLELTTIQKHLFKLILNYIQNLQSFVKAIVKIKKNVTKSYFFVSLPLLAVSKAIDDKIRNAHWSRTIKRNISSNQ